MRRLLARREREGLTFAELSQQSGVPLGTLASWSSRLRSEGSAELGGFVELTPPEELPQGAIDSARLEVVLGRGRRVLVPSGFEEDELLRLIRALES